MRRRERKPISTMVPSVAATRQLQPVCCRPAKVKKKGDFCLLSQGCFLSGLTGTLLSTRSHLAPITIDRRHLRADGRRPMSMFLFKSGDIKIVLFFFFFQMRENEVITTCDINLIRKTQPWSKRKKRKKKKRWLQLPLQQSSK